MNAEWDFLLHLKALGQKTADTWLRENWGHIGEQSSIDLRGIFLAAPASDRASDPGASSGPGGPVLAPAREAASR